eukprot:EG_transcript_2273
MVQGSVQILSSFVSNVLKGNSVLVESILDLQETSGVNRTEQTKVQITNTIGALVNYTTNTTDQTQRLMGTVVDTFAGLMGAVVADFKGLAGAYAARLRADLAAKGSDFITTSSVKGGNVKRRLQQLIDLDLLNLSPAPTDPIGMDDCMTLGVVCDSSTEAGGSAIVLVSATGRLYRCAMATEGGTVSALSYSGAVYNESYLRWRPYAAGVPAAAQKPMKQRCLTEAPAVDVVGLNCPQPQSCNCGADQRCNTWYQAYANAKTSYPLAMVYLDAGVPMYQLSLSLVNSSATPPRLLGVVGTNYPLTRTDAALASLSGMNNDTYLGMLLNDTVITMWGSIARKCAPNDTNPGDPSFPRWSTFRSCDPGLRAVARAIYDTRPITRPFALEAAGLIWEIYPVNIPAAMTYFFVVGWDKAVVNAPLEASEAAAASQITAVRANLIDKVAASGAATRSYMAAVGATGVGDTQSMQDGFLAELQALQASAWASLTASQALSTKQIQTEAATQVSMVAAQKAAQLDALAATTGWSLAVAGGILLAVLAASAWGTVRVAHSLTHIIGLMEDVAALRVEDLVVPQGASVDEVARIQSAFQVVVQRLAEYKGYIPAAAFEEVQPHQGAFQEAADEADDRAVPPPGSFSDRQPSSLPGHPPCHSAVANVPPCVGRSLPRNVAVLAVNVKGFFDLLHRREEASNAFNEYVIHVHDVVSKAGGNVDFLAGDQVLATFNAHRPCGYPAGVAAAAALDLRRQLTGKLVNQVQFQVGVAFGPAIVSRVGYAKFKSMVTIGSPMKLAATLSHVECLESGVVVADAALRELVKYTYDLQPLELLHLPHLKPVAGELPTSQRIFTLLGKKSLRDDEWLYQVGAEPDSSDWGQTFEHLVAAPSAEEARGLLEQYLSSHPTCSLALRLKDRLELWLPGHGITV